MPRTEAEELEIMRGFFAINNFPRVIGAIDGIIIIIILIFQFVTLVGL
jgi:hypothetical protein